MLETRIMEAVPYDPKYHAEWVKNNARANERNRRNDRPRNHDRSRNFERRREMDMHRQNIQNTGGQTFPGGPQNTGPNNLGYVPPNNMGGGTQTNPQYVDAQHSRGAPYQSGPEPSQNSYVSNTLGGHPYQYSGGQTFPGGPQNTGPNNLGYVPPNNMGGGTHTNPQYVDAQHSRGAPYQSGPEPSQNSYISNTSGGHPYQNNKQV